ncbi:phage head spike fiber domain-containing protein [Aeromonas caviae]|uniref:phage head spike fiber domain-containing protein n=1 Tax=Aeromonas caviae TaxID=648 RepID=UPI002B47FC22|nr:LamG-like jellyroll fold domain-containing protein [Aeromonas caviae]
MAGVWKRDGTVAVTNGNKKVTGTGTTFADTKNGVAKGHLFCITSGTSVDFYEVDYVVSNTELYLVQAYRGTTATGKAYEIITTFSDSVPEFARRLTATLSAYQQQSDAFQALLTSTATTVEVTAPDGTKQTLIPWKRVTSEGEGQAARAKTEADKAAASAALAGDIVAASALPLPDVWAPLSDSLRLITGYGRDVLVGSDVVARMVNFSRNSTATYIDKDGLLKTAAANEPRFEKEGLLIEGQSTNLVPRGSLRISAVGGVEGWSLSGAAGVTNSVSEVVDPRYGTLVRFGAGASRTAYVLQSLGGFEVGATYTISAHCSHDDTGQSILRVQDKGLAHSRVGDRVFATFVAEATSLSFQIGKGVLGIPSSTSSSVVMGNIQIEKLPFASSYIPTNGAAVTRAEDVCWIPNALNVTPDYGDITITAEVRRNIAIPANLFPRVINISLHQFVVADSTRIMARGGGIDQANLATAATGKLERVAATVNGNTIACFLNGAKATMQQTPILPVSEGEKCFIGSRNGLNGLFGHIRNVRIWQRTLSDDQIKAVT